MLVQQAGVLAQQLHKQVLQCYSLADNFYLKAFPRPEILLNLRGQSAGVAELRANRLRFNKILYQENQQAFLAEVVPHEVAHLIAWQVYGLQIRPHGKEWQQIMQAVFSLEPKRTHSFDIKRAAKLGYKYTCCCAEKQHALTVRRHNKILQGQGYICLACKSPLRFLQQDKNLLKK